MGKDLKGRELGSWPCTRKDGSDIPLALLPERGIESNLTLTRLRKHVTGYKTRNIMTSAKAL